MSLFIYKEAIGTHRNVILDDGNILWTPERIKSDFVYGCPSAKNAIEPLLQLFDVKLSEIVPRKFRDMMQICGMINGIPWCDILPKKLFLQNLKIFIRELSDAYSIIKVSDYSHFFISTNNILGRLSPCTVDKGFAQDTLRTSDSSALQSFLKADGQLPRYCRVSTKTGRLTIKEGPQILTLKKEYRKVLNSSFSDGHLYEIDFTSLEPRVAFNITAGEKLLPNEKSPSDLYQFFIEKQQINIQRDTAKLAVLCSLYGAGTSKLRSVLQKDGSSFSADMLIRRVESFFGLKELFSMLREQAQTGYITNFYGRPIEVTDARRNILVNNFLQSTAVDVALAGFCQIMEKIPSCKPVFIIHDALIMDVPKGQEDKLQDIVAQGFSDEKMGHFPLKLTRLK